MQHLAIAEGSCICFGLISNKANKESACILISFTELSVTMPGSIHHHVWICFNITLWSACVAGGRGGNRGSGGSAGVLEPHEECLGSVAGKSA